MDYKNDERYWNIKLLNKWFAISSILFLISIAWMFLDDNDDEFKVYQRTFRKIESQISAQKLQDELDKVSNKNCSNEIFNILIHLTDPNINKAFQDRFFQGIDFPLNKLI